MVQPIADGFLVEFYPLKTRSATEASSKQSFIVPTLPGELNPAGILAGYLALVKEDYRSGELWKNWQYQAKAYIQPRSSNSISQSGIKIAKLMKLASPNSYTGHTFRRTGANFFS